MDIHHHKCCKNLPQPLLGPKEFTQPFARLFIELLIFFFKHLLLHQGVKNYPGPLIRFLQSVIVCSFILAPIGNGKCLNSVSHVSNMVPFPTWGSLKKKTQKNKRLHLKNSTTKLNTLLITLSKMHHLQSPVEQKSFGPAGSPCVDHVHYVIGVLIAAGKKTKKTTLAGSKH